MPHTWILVAENSRAKLYSAKTRKAALAEVESLVHPEGRMHEGDLVSDHSGSDRGSIGQGRRAMENKTSARDAEHTNFARQIAARLENARHKGAYDKLVLIAPPGFLGLLRENLSKNVMERVTEEIDKNLVQKPAAVVREHLTCL